MKKVLKLVRGMLKYVQEKIKWERKIEYGEVMKGEGAPPFLTNGGSLIGLARYLKHHLVRQV